MESLAVALFAAAATWALLRGASRRAVAAMEAQLAVLREQNAALGSAAAYLRGEDKALEALRGETERRTTAEAGAARAGELDARVVQLNEELATLRASLATAEERLAAEQRSAQQSLRLLEEAREKLADAFKALCSEALKSNNRAGKAVESYNHATASLESRVLVSARRFSELQAAPADLTIAPLDPIERATRQLQAVELLPSPAARLQEGRDKTGTES